MERRLTIALPQDVDEELTALSDSIGFSREMAAEYAIRLVLSCVREGLIADTPPRAWPEEAQLLTGTGGKVIAFPGVGGGE